MARPKAEPPSPRYHISGQSIVTIQGRTFYLGPHNSPEALARYGALVVRYQRNGLKLPADFELSSLDPIVSAMLGDMFSMEPADQGNHSVLVRHITASVRERAKVRYAESHAELHRMNQVCDALDKHDGDLKASEYGPLALQKQRQRWIDEKLARTYCNRTTPLSCCNRPGTNKKTNPRKQPEAACTSCSYRQSIQRAAKRAGVPKWPPYPTALTVNML